MSAPPESPSPVAAPRRWWRGSWGWVSTTYFGEGLPYTIVNSAADALFTVMGMSLSTLGLTTIFHLPWNLKFLWGPFVDQYETKRWWLLATEVLLCGLLLLLTVVGDVDAPLMLVAGVFLLVAIVAATHDIAVDGFYLEGLDKTEQSRYVGYRAAAYRLAMLAVNGPLLVLADVMGWRLAWLCSLAVMVGLVAYHAAVLPRPETPGPSWRTLVYRATRPPIVIGLAVLVTLSLWGAQHEFWGIPAGVRSAVSTIPVLGAMSLPGWIGVILLGTVLGMLAALPWLRARLARRDSAYARSFVVFLDKPRVVPLLAFVLLFRTGESFLQKMRWPFLHRELDVSLSVYGVANGTVGLAATFVATLLGGYLIARHGLRRWIWPFLIAQNVLNLLYAGLAMWPDPSQIDLSVITVVVTIEHFGEGLGTAVFMVYLMRCCDPEHKAAHMALLTALMSVGFTLAGVASGALAERMGFGPYFLFTFVATLPSMALVLVVPHLKEDDA